MGAYIFDADPSFTVRAGNLTDYTEDNSSKVVFPGGIVVQDHLVHVA